MVVVKDQQIRSRLRDLYSPGWADYLTLTAAGLRPWSPVNDRAAEREALSAGAGHTGEPGGFAAHLDTVPVLLMVFADLAQLAAVDRDLDRYTFAGGASVYPFVWSLLLAARAEGLGGVLTTMLIRQEDEVKRLLAAPRSSLWPLPSRSATPCTSPRGCAADRWRLSPPWTGSMAHHCRPRTTDIVDNGRQNDVIHYLSGL